MTKRVEQRLDSIGVQFFRWRAHVAILDRSAFGNNRSPIKVHEISRQPGILGDQTLVASTFGGDTETDMLNAAEELGDLRPRRAIGRKGSTRIVAAGVAALFVVAGFVLPGLVLDDGLSGLSPRHRAAAVEARENAWWIIWDLPFTRIAFTHVKVLDVSEIDPDSVGLCSGDANVAGSGPCRPALGQTPECRPDGSPAARVGLRGYTWAGIPRSDAVIVCESATTR